MRGDARGAYQYLASDGKTILPMSGSGVGSMPPPSTGGTGIMHAPQQMQGEMMLVTQPDGSVVRMMVPIEEGGGISRQISQAGMVWHDGPASGRTPRMPVQQVQHQVDAEGSGSSQQSTGGQAQFPRTDYQTQNEFGSGSGSSHPTQSYTGRILSEGPEVDSPIHMVDPRRAAPPVIGIPNPVPGSVSFPDLHASLQAMEGGGMRPFHPGEAAALVGRDIESLSPDEHAKLAEHGFRAKEVMADDGQIVRVVEPPEGSIVQEVLVQEDFVLE